MRQSATESSLPDAGRSLSKRLSPAPHKSSASLVRVRCSNEHCEQGGASHFAQGNRGEEEGCDKLLSCRNFAKVESWMLTQRNCFTIVGHDFMYAAHRVDGEAFQPRAVTAWHQWSLRKTVMRTRLRRRHRGRPSNSLFAGCTIAQVAVKGVLRSWQATHASTAFARACL